MATLLLYAVVGEDKVAVEVPANGTVRDVVTHLPPGVVLGSGGHTAVEFAGQLLADSTLLADSGVSSEATVHIRRQPKLFAHVGSWSACGGNPRGTVRCRGNGNCSTSCVDCGASSRWTCCGSSDRASKQCLPWITEEDADSNFRLLWKPYDPDAPQPRYPPGAED